MMNRNTRILMVTVAMTLISTACVKEKLEVTYNKQEDKIDQYIKSNKYITTDGEQDSLRVVYNSGSVRMVMQEGMSEELKADGTIAFYYAGYTFSGSKSNANLFITNHEETAKNAGWELTGQQFSIYQIKMNETELLPGLRSGLLGVKSGEHCQILFSGKYGYGNEEFGIIPANSALLYEIWVEAVSND